MNYLAHGRELLHDPYQLAGSAVPDWLSVVDRQVRVRAKQAKLWVEDDDPQMAAVARGIVRHLSDDDWFHQTTAFHELNVAFTGRLRLLLPDDDGYRPAFLGHILVELLLDAWLAQERGELLDGYYAALAAVDPMVVERAVNRIATRPTDRLALLVPRFLQERFLYDYADDLALWKRLNQVMQRVKLPPLPERLMDLFPECRRAVAARADQLLTL